MDYHRGLLRQRGHGFFRPLLKLGLPLVGSAVAPLLGDLAGGLLKHRQKGSGFVTNALKTGAKHGIVVAGNAALIIKEHFCKGLGDTVPEHLET